MPLKRVLHIVGVHAEGEVGDVVIGGVLDPPGCKTMYEKLVYFRDEADGMRQLLMNEPRGRSSMCMNIILPPCNPKAHAGFLVMESEEYAPMSGSNTICTATVLLETGMIEMKEPITKLQLDTPAGLIGVEAECESGKCKSVSLDNVPAFVYALDQVVEVPGLGSVKVDIAWGGMWFALVDAESVGLTIDNAHGSRLIETGERIKRAVQASCTPVHPENPAIRGISTLEFTEPLQDGPEDSRKAKNTVVVSPGRFDRSPCGTGTCARMAVLHSRGQLNIGQTFRHSSIIGSELVCHLRGETKVGNYNAVLPTVKGRAWLTGFRQSGLDPTDPFPLGYRVGDQWHVAQ